MKNTFKKLIPIVMIMAILFSSLGVSAFAAQSDVNTAKTIATKIAAWQLSNNPVDIGNTDINGNIDWAAFGCFRGGYNGYENYLSYAGQVVEENFDSLYLSDIARLVLAVGAAGGNAKSVGGHDLIAAITSSDFDSQTMTASISYALLALNSKSYAEQSVTDKLVQILLTAQRTDGGFNYLLKIDSENEYSQAGDVDSTAMVLQALAPYAEDTAVAAVIGPALAFINASQKDSGGFGGAWGESADTTSQVITALCALGIDPLGDAYIKGGKTVLDAIKTYQNEDGGINGWDGKSNIMSSYQMVYALTAYIRFAEDACGLFDFSDVVPDVEETTQTQTTEISTETGTEETTETVTETEIPQTGSGTAAGTVVLLLAGVAFITITKMRKDEK